MNLGEKIKQILEDFDPTKSNVVVAHYNSSRDNHEKTYTDISPKEMTVQMMINLLRDFNEYGECAWGNPKGHWVKYIDFELKG